MMNKLKWFFNVYLWSINFLSLLLKATSDFQEMPTLLTVNHGDYDNPINLAKGCPNFVLRLISKQ